LSTGHVTHVRRNFHQTMPHGQLLLSLACLVYI